MDDSQDGMLAALIGQGLSGNKSYIYISVGGHKIQQVRDELLNPSCQERRNATCTPSHAVTDAGIQNISELGKEWDSEDKFSISHSTNKTICKGGTKVQLKK